MGAITQYTQNGVLKNRITIDWISGTYPEQTAIIGAMGGIKTPYFMAKMTEDMLVESIGHELRRVLGEFGELSVIVDGSAPAVSAPDMPTADQIAGFLDL